MKTKYHIGKCPSCGKKRALGNPPAGKGKTISAKEVCSILDSIIEKPDPIQLGEELAVFLRDKTVLWQKDSLSWQDSPEVEAFLRIIWERDFWRSKCLGQ